VIGYFWDIDIVVFDLGWFRYSGKMVLTDEVVNILDITGFLG
jgi:hypothetical protein